MDTNRSVYFCLVLKYKENTSSTLITVTSPLGHHVRVKTDLNYNLTINRFNKFTHMSDSFTIRQESVWNQNGSGLFFVKCGTRSECSVDSHHSSCQ